MVCRFQEIKLNYIFHDTGLQFDEMHQGKFSLFLLFFVFTLFFGFSGQIKPLSAPLDKLRRMERILLVAKSPSDGVGSYLQIMELALSITKGRKNASNDKNLFFLGSLALRYAQTRTTDRYSRSRFRSHGKTKTKACTKKRI